MKIRLWLSLVIMFLVLTACAPVAAMPTEIQLTSIEMPAEATKASTPTETPTEIPTSTPTTIPTLEGLSIPVPDPRISNPEFFDVSDAKSPIVKFARAFAIKPEDVIVGLDFEVKQDIHGNDFVVMRTSDGVALMMDTQGENGDWIWQEATPGSYWHTLGKYVGTYMGGDDLQIRNYRDSFSKYFQNGILALDGQVRPNAEPYRPPSNANDTARYAQQNFMSLFIHYVAEPGKFPSNLNTKNIDSWLATRLEGFAQVIKAHKTDGQPTYVSFNEAWEGNVWNPESNPLRDKYGNQWIEEYLYQAVTKFSDEGLIPNKDFVLVFNDGNMYNRPKKQELVYQTLSEARINAFNRLVTDPNMKVKLNGMGINQAEDIDILLGAETHTQLDGNRDDGFRIPPPKDIEIINLSEKFKPLGGILMTEVNPEGTAEQQEGFVRRISSLLPETPSFKGIIWWNIFRSSTDTPDNVWGRTILRFFEDDGTPTRLYYELFHH